MAMDALQVWKDEWDNLPLDDTGLAFPMNIANFIGDRVDGKMVAKDVEGAASFTFNRAVFAAGIASLVPSPSNIAGVTAICSAWQSAILASVLVIPPGSYIKPTPTPATTWSVVASVVPIPAAGFASLQAGLLAAPLAGAPGESAFPVELRKAFELLQYTISGTDSTPTPAGPLPLTFVSGVE